MLDDDVLFPYLLCQMLIYRRRRVQERENPYADSDEVQGEGLPCECFRVCSMDEKLGKNGGGGEEVRLWCL
jgi:hypothetical protein